jgi:hypothetical protein
MIRVVIAQWHASPANQGWMPPDSRACNEEAAERGWARKLELFKKALA